MAEQAAPQWWESRFTTASSLPAAQSSCPEIEASEVWGLLERDAAEAPGTPREFLIVDVRQKDCEGGTLATSVNFPAQTFLQTRAAVYRLLKQAGVRRVIFYCGSCGTRGPRTAGWMQDYLNEVGEKDIEVLILKGGIKGWVKTYGGKLMDSYDEQAW